MVTKKIQVIPVQQGKEFIWRMSHGGQTGGPGNYPTVTVAPKAAADFEITIVNPQGITFSGDPIWIKAGETKPQSSFVDPQITNISGKNSTVLKFRDENTGPPTKLTYQLNFTNAPPLDPIIQNGGGTGPGEPVLAYAAIALLVLVGVWLVVRAMRRAAGSQAHQEKQG